MPAWRFGDLAATTSIQSGRKRCSATLLSISQSCSKTCIKADVLIGTGDVPKVLRQGAKQTNADLLVTGCYRYGENQRTHGYAIICAVSIPVLNV
jgi:nucleotide-binding universal stress UspA family protein